jgi:hypothetical protein
MKKKAAAKKKPAKKRVTTPRTPTPEASHVETRARSAQPTEQTETKERRKRERPVSSLQAALNHLERYKYESQYIGKDTYRITAGGQRYYFSSEAVMTLSAQLGTTTFGETLQSGRRQTKYDRFLQMASTEVDANEDAPRRPKRAPSRKANRAAVVSDGSLPDWKQKVLERASTQLLITKINAATAAQPLAESDLDAKYERRLAKIAASAGAVQMETRGKVVVFFGKSV